MEAVGTHHHTVELDLLMAVLSPQNTGLSLNRIKEALANLGIGRALASILPRGPSVFGTRFGFNSLTARILAVNLLVFIVLVISIFYFNNAEAFLITAKRDALKKQGQIIAHAVVQATKGPRRQKRYDSSFLKPANAARGAGSTAALKALEFTIEPHLIAPIFRQLVEPSGTRARIYDQNYQLIVDSDFLLTGRDIGTIGVSPAIEPPKPSISSLWNRLLSWSTHSDLPLYKDVGRGKGDAYTGVRLALAGQTTAQVMVNEHRQRVVSVATPIRASSEARDVAGVLLLATRGAELDDLLAAERASILWVSLLTLAVVMFASVFMASTFGRPLHRLSDAADRVRHNLNRREELPDFTHRPDEIGYLSAALRDMTSELYRRLEASDRFAADVAHELKNPLTSVRSAAETLSVVKTHEARAELVATIQSDVKRLTRLIDDISNASRLDAEMRRAEAGEFDLSELIKTLADICNDSIVKHDQRVITHFDPPSDEKIFEVRGQDTRIGQVMNNLLSNALSFSPPDGEVKAVLRREARRVVIMVEDQGPGIPPEQLDRVFERFYTDRPESQGFGNNSGLGLSISRAIIEAHGGRIYAENIYPPGVDGEDESAERLGARFIVVLPAPPLKPDQRGKKIGGGTRAK